MARTGKAARQLIDRLARPGDAEVLHGELALVGLPGAVFTPASGHGLPAVAFGHGWMQPLRRYTHLLRHLASWGFVVLAPDTERGPLGSVRSLAADLSTALDVGIGVRLGTGELSVDPDRIAVAGHGTGANAAVLAAAVDGRVRAVTMLAPSQTHPPASAAAESVSCPCLMLVAERDRVAPAVAHAEPVAVSWAGPITVRTLRKASHFGFLSGRHWTDALLDGKPEHTTQRSTLALTTAFLLQQLTGTKEYDSLLAGELREAPLWRVPRPADS
jgi:dienelactone hydrolase